jgi:hypothetical protein
MVWSGTTLKNTSDEVQRAGVLGWLENAVCFDSAKAVHAVRHSRIVNDNGGTMIVHTAEETPK